MRSGLLALRRLGVRLFLALTALQAVILGVLVALAEFRKRRRGPREGFPWEEQPEIELESGEDRLKIYAYGVRLYEEMLEEIESADPLFRRVPVSLSPEGLRVWERAAEEG